MSETKPVHHDIFREHATLIYCGLLAVTIAIAAVYMVIVGVIWYFMQ
ncbi:hypothetical protein ACFQBQ_02855 [Granulicella cerasi]|uniref:Uncharacterized protein n=1 Tax=Granulicella cerasi TaxID=741063 RepID=A0ABW1Z4Q0_9BACT|nr:hypothetical protein [Granulicella cerasi]